MNYYKPVEANKQFVPLPFQFFAYKYNFLWPLSEEASWAQNALQRSLIGLSLLFYIATLLAEFTFVSENTGDIPALSECFCTSLMGVQYLIRITILGLRQRQMRALYTRFYRQIYFTTGDDVELCKEIKIITHFTNFFTRIYFIPMVMIVIMYVVDVLSAGMDSPQKPYIYRMSFRWYDAQVPVQFVLTAFYTGWLNVSCVGLMSAEDFSLCIMLCHTSYRFKALRKSLRCMLKDSQDEVKRGGMRAGVDLHTVFRRRLYEAFRQQQALYSFIVEAKAHFTYQIFLCMSFGVLLLCVVAFQFQRTDIGLSWVKYIVWLISQTAQFIMIGYFGQMLMDETTAMHNSYYMCQWEDLLPFGDPRQNNALMHDIQFAIMNAEQPVIFDGMKLLPLTHSTVGAALRSAMSYFMFLNTMNDANKSK